jgi:hypothetical protein
MKKNKTRPVLVISTNKSLIDRALIIELGSDRINDNSIFFYSYVNKIGEQKDSYIFPDRIHTVNRYYLRDKNKLRNRKIPIEIREQILIFTKKIFNEE